MVAVRMRVVIGTSQHDDAIEIPSALVRAMLLPERPVLDRIDAFAECVGAYERARAARVPWAHGPIGEVAWTVEGPRRCETGRATLTSDGGPMEAQIRAGLRGAAEKVSAIA